MNISTNLVKITNKTDDDFLLCRAFSKAISSDKLDQIIQQQTISTQFSIDELNVSSDEKFLIADDSSLQIENIQWKIGDLCLCPYSEDGLLYKATIIDISLSSKSCTILFDDYGNEEIHQLTDLKKRIEEEGKEEEAMEESSPIDENDILPPPPVPPPFPDVNSGDDKDSLSSTLMSWYLAGYHTGFYQGVKEKRKPQ